MTNKKSAFPHECALFNKPQKVKLMKTIHFGTILKVAGTIALTVWAVYVVTTIVNLFNQM